jgi:glycosyltransferase involved in cell wall biosynthesis
MSPTRAMKILWLAKGLGPGGAERLLVAMAGTLDNARFRVQAAYLLPGKTHLVEELAAAGVPSMCLGGGSPYDLRWALRLRRLVVDDAIDIVHVHAPYVAAVARPVLRSLGRRRPAVVYTEHNSWDGYGRATRWANALTYPLDDARVTVSPAALASIPRLFRGHTEVLVHGVDLDAVRSHLTARARLREELGVDDDTTVAVTIANLRHHKDYPTLLHAARIVKDSGANVRFAAVGQGPLEQEIRALAGQLGLAESFQLLGYRDDALDVLGAGDVFVLSSLAEGYPVSLMEALALGLPVVATAVGGIPDAVHQGVEGVLVPPSRPDLLAEAVLEIARDPDRRSSLAAGAAAAAWRFDIRRATARIEAAYDEVSARVVRGRTE